MSDGPFNEENRRKVDAMLRAVNVALLSEHPLGLRAVGLVAHADCQRCGAPAHPIRGYCGRFCEEAARYEAERREGETWTLHCHKPGYHPRIAGLDPVTPEETTAAYVEAYAAIERDLRETVAASSASFGPAARAALLGDDP